MTSSSNSIIVIGAGQSGLTAARAARDAGLSPLVLEASDRAAGSWPDYYDSLAAFSPTRFSGIAGFPMSGEPDEYPGRDDVAAYLERFADSLDVEIRTGTRVESVSATDRGFVVRTAAGETVEASGIVAASGAFGNPFQPRVPGQDDFGGQILHAAEYREPKPFAGRRVLVVGAGNSAVQIAAELDEVATVTVASRQTPLFVPQLIGGRDVHHVLTKTVDRLPLWLLSRLVKRAAVIDSGRYREVFAAGAVTRRDMFSGFETDAVVWPDGRREPVDVVLWATGYRPNLGYLARLGALDANGTPRHRGGVSTTHSGLGYVGLEFQRSFASNTLRGVAADAEYVVDALVTPLRRPAVRNGLSIVGHSRAAPRPPSAALATPRGVGESGEHLDGDGDLVAAHRVDIAAALGRGGDEPLFAQRREVVGDQGLRQPGRFGELTHTAGAFGQQQQQGQPGLVGQGLELRGQ